MFADTNNNGTPEMIEESHYYAFGMRIEGLSTTNPDNKFTYNGKELEDDHGLNWYHYGARFYDAQIGRWHVVDPALEFFSPYVYTNNDPIGLFDPDGTQTGNPTVKFIFNTNQDRPPDKSPAVWFAAYDPKNNFSEFDNYQIQASDGKISNLGDVLRVMQSSVNAGIDAGDDRVLMSSNIISMTLKEQGLSIDFKNQRVALQLPESSLITTGDKSLKGGVVFKDDGGMIKLRSNSSLEIAKPDTKGWFERLIIDLFTDPVPAKNGGTSVKG